LRTLAGRLERSARARLARASGSNGGASGSGAPSADGGRAAPGCGEHAEALSPLARASYAICGEETGWWARRATLRPGDPVRLLLGRGRARARIEAAEPATET
jgi:hypothetical protein